jgi:two-component system NarL family response regulator
MTEARTRIDVGIVEDHPMTTAGLRNLFAGRDRFRVIWDAATGGRALALCVESPPDVVLVDMLLPDMTGADLIRAARGRAVEARFLVLSSSAGSEHIHRALSAGASGYLLKNASADALVGAIESVHAGKKVIPEEVAERLSERPPESDLTDRELDVLRCLVRGGANHEIATTLGIGTGTIRTHISHILLKLGASDRAAAVSIALRRGIVRGDS